MEEVEKVRFPFNKTRPDRRTMGKEITQPALGKVTITRPVPSESSDWESKTLVYPFTSFSKGFGRGP